MLNRLVSAATTATIIIVVLLTLGLTDLSQLQFVGAAAAATYACWGLAALHRRHMGVAAPISSDDTPLSAALWGARRALVLASSIAVALGGGWMFGMAAPIWRSGNDSRPLFSTETAWKDVEADVDVVDVFVRPPTLHVDVELKSSDGEPMKLLPSDELALTLADQAVAVEHVEEITYERDLADLIVRDASNSASAAPFPQLTETATALLLQSHRDSSRVSRVRVVNFDAETREIIPWSTRPPTPPSLRPVTMRQADKSALFAAITAAIDDLATQEKAARLLILIVDGGNNVASSYSAKGLVALARSKQVVIHVVALPTEQLNEPFLRLLAAETGGRYLDASRDMDQVAELVAVRDVRRAFRLVASHAGPVEQRMIGVKIRSSAVSSEDAALRPGAAPVSETSLRSLSK